MLNSPEVTKHSTFIVIQTDKWLKKLRQKKIFKFTTYKWFYRLTYDGDDCTGFDLGRKTTSSSSRSLTRAFNAFLSCKMSRNSGNENRGLKKISKLLSFVAAFDWNSEISGLRSAVLRLLVFAYPQIQNN